MNTISQYLDSIVSKGGPEPDDFEHLNLWFQSIEWKINNSIIKRDVVRKIWDYYGDVFSEKTMQGFVAQKPHGYPGDFEIIDRIYTRWISPDPNLSKWDHFFHALPAVQAVRNRKEYFKNLLSELEKSNNNKTIRVLNVGSGPARDVYEYCCENPDTCIIFECVDMDETAIKHAKSMCHSFLDRITFHHRNIFRFRTHSSYEVIWSAGLFDYLNDKRFKYLASKLYCLLNHDGKLVIGNFSTANPNRDYMELGEWFLEHRNEDDLISLALACGIDQSNISVEVEPEGINLFLHIDKQLKAEEAIRSAAYA